MVLVKTQCFMDCRYRHSSDLKNVQYNCTSWYCNKHLLLNLPLRWRLRPRVWSPSLLRRLMKERKTWSRLLGCQLCCLTFSCAPSLSSRVTATSWPKCSPWPEIPWTWWRDSSCWRITLRYQTTSLTEETVVNTAIRCNCPSYKGFNICRFTAKGLFCIKHSHFGIL